MAAEDRRRWLLRGSVLALALVVALVAWLTTRDGGEPAASEASSETRIVDAAELGNIAALAGHPVYWAGPVRGTELEVTESAGNVQLRYLAEGAPAGEGDAEALTVGSYPLPDPAGALAAFAKRPGTVSHRGSGGREVVVSERNPTSAYFTSSDGSVQVEVYDPSPKRALALALSSKVRPAG